jgi:hypothetical protein
MTEQDRMSEMSDEGLVRASLDSETYDHAFRQRVETELTYRGLTVESFADRVFMRDRTGDASCTISESLEKFDQLSVWSPVE